MQICDYVIYFRNSLWTSWYHRAFFGHDRCRMQHTVSLSNRSPERMIGQMQWKINQQLSEGRCCWSPAYKWQKQAEGTTRKSVNEFKTQTLLFLRTVLEVSKVLSHKKLYSLKPPPHTTVHRGTSGCRAGWAQGKTFKDSKEDSKIIKNFWAYEEQLSMKANTSDPGALRPHGRHMHEDGLSTPCHHRPRWNSQDPMS